MSNTKAEIEAEIARLRARLDHVEIDPAFTPSELVRWDPSLLGAVLHIKHERRFYSSTFHKVMTIESGTPATPSVDYMYMASDPSRIRRPPPDPKLPCYNTSVCNHPPPPTHDQACDRVISTENTGVLTQLGIRTVCDELIERQVDRHTLVRRYGTTNNFTDIATLPLVFQLLRKETGIAAQAAWTHGPGGVFDLKCSDLGITVRQKMANGSGQPNLLLPLANPSRPLLDQIFVATMTRIGDTDVIVDKYPLSTLYNEWKRDKAAAPDVMTVCGARRPTVPPLRRTELDKAKEQIAELQVRLRALIADHARAAELSKQNGQLREALHVAVQTPISTNATAMTNATTDPM